LGPPANQVNELARRRKGKGKQEPQQVMVKYVENHCNEGQVVTVTVKEDLDCDCSDESDNNNFATVKEVTEAVHQLTEAAKQVKDTVVEKNGNVDVLENVNAKNALVDNYVPVIAQV
jgi:hypothetical protein